jgi:glycosyltransferase involved in cell wall biosynthesis
MLAVPAQLCCSSVMQAIARGRNASQIWGINGRFLTQRVTGVQRYAYEILIALDAILSQESGRQEFPSLRLILPPGVKDVPLLSKIVICPTGFGAGHVWDQLVLPLRLGSGLVGLGNFGPLFVKKQIVCIHDANVYIEPESYSSAFRFAYRALLPWVGRRASRIATVSQFSADMLCKYGVTRREKIFIAPNGHEHALRWNAQRGETPLLASLKRPFVLVLGSIAKHKNVEIVLKQAAGLDEAGIDIVLVGAASTIFSTSLSAVSRPNVHRVGYVSDDELAALYGRALCLVFPSKTEGFGIPPLEAMARGCPVIVSNIPSLLEVGGDAAVYVDPADGDGWRQTIIGLSGNEGLRATMSELGCKRSALFSWKRSAKLYLDEISRLSKEG